MSEDRMQGIPRYEPEGYKDHLGFRIPGACTTQRNGEYVLYEAHRRALHQLRVALEGYRNSGTNRWHTSCRTLENGFDNRCNLCKVCDAALETTK